jgi:iron complex outermembrane recepter protein
MRRWILALFVFLAAAALAGATTLRGVARDSVTGKPIPQARVELLQAAGTLVVTTDDAGSFAFEVRETGPVTLVVSHPGYQVARMALATLPEQPLAVALDPIISIADGIEVTATRAREGTDPVSFTNIPQEHVQEAYWAQDPAILLSSVAPSFFAYNDSGNGIGYSYFWVRGFSQSLTRVTLNGAPLNDADSGELFFIDLADFLSTSGDIQIQRGVFGLSGIGGAVDITTAPPQLQSSFLLQTGFGSYNTRRLSARYDSGLINGTWALTARYSKVTTDGYRDQSWVDMWNYFLSLTRFAEDSRLRLVMFGGPEQTHLAYDGIPKYVLDGGLTGNADKDRRFNPLTYPNELDNFMQPHFQLIHELAISPTTQLSQTLYYFSGRGSYDQYKSDRTLAEYYLPNVLLPDSTVISESDLVRRRTVDEGDTGWVPTLTHTTGPWTLTARGEVRLHDAHHFGEVTWAQYYPEGVPPDHRYYDYHSGKRTAALALGAAWNVNSTVTLSAGLEYASHRYTMSKDRIKGVGFSENYGFMLPRLGAIVHLGPDTHLYANVARGMREPNFRDIYDPQDYYGTRATLRPEDVWDWEAGVSLRGSWLRARANVFWMTFSNEIVYAGALDDNGVPIYGNGARSRHRGVELEARWDPSPGLGLDAALTYSRNTFTRYRQYNWDETVSVFDGNRIAGYPDLLAAVTARTSVGPVQLALTGKRVGRFYVDNTQDNRNNPEARQQPGYVPLVNPAFTVVNFTARTDLPTSLTRAVGLNRIGLELRLNNLLNETYTAFGYADSGEPFFIPAATRNVYVGLTLGL